MSFNPCKRRFISFSPFRGIGLQAYGRFDFLQILSVGISIRRVGHLCNGKAHHV